MSTSRHEATTKRLGFAVAAALLIASCGSDATSRSNGAEGPTPVIDPGDGGHYYPDIGPGDFVTVIDNPYLPFQPGSRWTYENPTDEGSNASRSSSWTGSGGS